MSGSFEPVAAPGLCQVQGVIHALDEPVFVFIGQELGHTETACHAYTTGEKVLEKGHESTTPSG
jgi:hypothetical protein